MRFTTTSRALITLLTLAAVPALAQEERPPQFRGPPPEALAACRGLTRGASCTVTPPGGTAVRGTCGSPAEDLPLACMPAGHGPGHREHLEPPPEALAACLDTDMGDACAVETPHGILEGSCRSMRDGRVACVPSERPPSPRSAP